MIGAWWQFIVTPENTEIIRTGREGGIKFPKLKSLPTSNLFVDTADDLFLATVLTGFEEQRLYLSFALKHHTLRHVHLNSFSPLMRSRFAALLACAAVPIMGCLPSLIK